MSKPSPHPVSREEDRLDERIARDRLKPRHLRAIAKELARQHAEAAPAIEHGGEPAALLRSSREQLAELRERRVVSVPEHRALESRVTNALTHDVPTLLERHATGHSPGRVLQIQGTLAIAAVRVRGRSATIARPAADDARGADVATEVAAISSALRARGREDFAELLLAAYALAADDYGLYRVIDIYETLAACERAAETLDEAAAREQIAYWIDPDASSPTGDATGPSLILMVGGVASGKSTLAKALVRELAAPRIVADRVRAAILDPVAEQAGEEAVLERAWSDKFDDRALTALLLRAKDVLASGRSCVIDSCSPFRRYRERWADLSTETGARFLQCTCVASAARIRKRLEARDERDGVVPGAWGEIARRLERPFEPVGSDETGRHLRINTDATLESGVALVVEALRRKARPANRTLQPGWPEAVTFDCWNTLLQERNWPVAHGLRVDALSAAAIEDGADLDRAQITEAFDVAWQRHMDLWVDGVSSGAREVARWSLEHLQLPLPELVIEHLTERFQHASHSGEVAAVEGARETLIALCDAGVRVALICDTGLTPGRVVRQHLERQGLLRHLRVEIFSDEVGVPKPDSRIFQAALGSLEARPEDSVHVGDLRRTDVAGACGIGMGSVRLRAAYDDTDDSSADADAVADSHAGLLAILRNWKTR